MGISVTYRNNYIQALIRRVATSMVEETMQNQKIIDSFRVQSEKTHFIPKQYRVIGGLLQSLNIRFGNFLELLLREIIISDPLVSIMDLSGRKVKLSFSNKSDEAIDRYISDRQQPGSGKDCSQEFETLMRQIIINENQKNSPTLEQGKDIDCLFMTKKDNKIFYVEVKYNDDHDTGKFVDINRKIIKTYAGLVNTLKITDRKFLELYLWYFTPVKRWISLYLPEENILRGPQLFERYFDTKYEDIDFYLQNIGEDPDMLRLFDELYRNIRHGKVINGKLINLSS
jgi:hypothetical protein